ncbi:MAG: hypothetical protein R3F39_14505 [Myxococcota bacterium]
MPENTTKSATRSPDTLMVVGAAMLAGGAAALVCRYKFFPLGMGGIEGALLTGGPIGLCMAGITQMRAAHRQGVRRQGWKLFAAALAAAAVVAGLFMAFAPSRTPTRVPLRAWTVPGIRVGLPDWAVEQQRDDSLPGLLRVADPMGGDRFVELRWAPGDPLSDEDMAAILSDAGGLSTVATEDATVDQRPARITYLESDEGGKRVAITSFHCPATKISGALITFVSMSREDLLALHQRVLQSVDCAPLAATETPRTSFPTFTPPPGYTPTEHPIVRAWLGEDDGVFDLPPGIPGERRHHELEEMPATREQILRAELGLRDIVFDRTPIKRARPDGEERVIYQAGGRDGAGLAVRAMLTWWHCETDGNTYIALHAGPVSIPAEPIMKALTDAGCP